MPVHQSFSSSDWYRQKEHAAEMRAVRAFVNVNGVTRSQAKKALQQFAQADIARRNEEARNRPVVRPEIQRPEIKRTEQVLPPIKRADPVANQPAAPVANEEGEWLEDVRICIGGTSLEIVAVRVRDLE